MTILIQYESENKRMVFPLSLPTLSPQKIDWIPFLHTFKQIFSSEQLNEITVQHGFKKRNRKIKPEDFIALCAFVIDTPKWPKVDGIACPETDEYNVLVIILEKEKRHLPLCAAAPTVTQKMSHKKTIVIVSDYKLTTRLLQKNCRKMRNTKGHSDLL